MPKSKLRAPKTVYLVVFLILNLIKLISCKISVGKILNYITWNYWQNLLILTFLNYAIFHGWSLERSKSRASKICLTQNLISCKMSVKFHLARVDTYLNLSKDIYSHSKKSESKSYFIVLHIMQKRPFEDMGLAHFGGLGPATSTLPTK